MTTLVSNPPCEPAAWSAPPRWRSPFPEAGPDGSPTPRIGFSSYTVRGDGQYVLAVAPGTTAARIGLKPGDVVVALNGVPLHRPNAWDRAWARSQDGAVRLTVRDGRTGAVTRRTKHLGDVLLSAAWERLG